MNCIGAIAQPVTDLCAEVRARCKSRLESPELAAAGEALSTVEIGPAQIADFVGAAARTAVPADTWDLMAGACDKRGIAEDSRILQRFILLTAALPNVVRVAELPVPDEVKRRLLDQFLYVCDPKRHTERLLNARDYGFRVMCKFSRLERFPAGQLDWEVSAVPRSWLRKMPVRDVARALKALYVRAGGHAPFFEAHTAIRRDCPILTPEDERRAISLFADAMRKQPCIRGYFGSSWLLDPTLAGISPHMAWLVEWYRECERHGALWTNVGPADPGMGFLVGDPRRRKLYESGEWKPVAGLVVWARKDLLRWREQQQPEALSG